MINVGGLQTKLDKAGYDIGGVDGVFGPKTATALLAYVAQRPMGPLVALGCAFAAQMPASDIFATAYRLGNFIGQACFESGYFRYLSEIWGPTDAQKGYEGRADLGNTQPGDGYKFRGRGLFQVTGRYGYTKLVAALALPLDTNPELLEQPIDAVKSAIYFWDTHGLSELADEAAECASEGNANLARSCEDQITKKINGGSNGLSPRRQLVTIAKGLLTS